MTTTHIELRPAGQPGTVNRNHHALGWTYPAVQRPDGTVTYWRDTDSTTGRWLAAPPMLAASFEAGPDWQADCHHQHGAPWRTCDTETACAALKRETGDWR